MSEEMLDIELYKSMRQEFETYSTYQQSLWRIKFITIGSIVAFFFGIGSEVIDLFPGKEFLFLVFIFILPALSFYLDLKILEATLHLRAMSEFIINEFSEFKRIVKWEKSIWSHSQFHFTRKSLTIFSAIGSSVMILFLCIILMLNVEFGNSNLISKAAPVIITLGLLASLIGILGAIWFSKKIKTKFDLP